VQALAGWLSRETRGKGGRVCGQSGCGRLRGGTWGIREGVRVGVLCVWEVVVWRGWAAGLRGGRQSAGGGGGVGVRGEGEAECDFTCNLTTAPPPLETLRALPAKLIWESKEHVAYRSLAVSQSTVALQRRLIYHGRGRGQGEESDGTSAPRPMERAARNEVGRRLEPALLGRPFQSARHESSRLYRNRGSTSADRGYIDSDMFEFSISSSSLIVIAC
jgi:hypothetical protein